MLQGEREQPSMAVAGEPCVYVCIPHFPSPSSHQLQGLQSWGRWPACLCPALTWTQLRDDIGRCHSQVWMTSSQRPLAGSGFFAFPTRAAPEQRSQGIEAQTPGLKHAAVPTGKLPWPCMGPGGHILRSYTQSGSYFYLFEEWN